MRRFFTLLTLLIIFPVFFSACTKQQGATETVAVESLSPEQSVERFVRLSGSASSAADQAKLREMCQGKLRQAFEKMSPENFQMTYLAGGVTVDSFKILSQKVEGPDALIRYQVSIQNKQGTEPSQETNEREVSLVQVNGTWYLDSIRTSGKDQVAFVNGMIF